VASDGTFRVVRNFGRICMDGRLELGEPMANVEEPVSRTGSSSSSSPPALSSQERRVANLVCSGLSNKQIAVRSGLSEHTVSSYLRRIYSKVGVNSRVGLVLFMHAAEPTADDAPVSEPMGL
jgi:DNA-binding NarL/FixJ family response regulator